LPTCFPTKGGFWLVGLANADEAILLALQGGVACIVLFPQAPSYKGLGDGKRSDVTAPPRTPNGLHPRPTAK
jgi:hypothetical protein